MIIGGNTVPTTISLHGRYLYTKEIIGYNGEGAAIESRYARLTWTFDALDMSDYIWIYSTLLGGAPSVKFTSATMTNNLGATITPTNIVVIRPTYEYASGGLANSVVWEMTRIS